MAEFENGDMVMLKSGGPVMTVNGARAGGKLECVWFTNDGKENSALFDPSALKEYKDDN